MYKSIIPLNCKTSQFSARQCYVLCDIGDVKFLDDVIRVSVKLTTRSEITTNIIEIVSSIKTRSNDTMVDRKKMISEVKVEYLPNIRITGYSSPDQHVSRKGTPDNMGHENITHTYDITNYGPSALSRGTLLIHVPVMDDYIKLQAYTLDTDHGISCLLDRHPKEPAHSDTRQAGTFTKLSISCEHFPCLLITCDVCILPSQQSITLKAIMSMSRGIFVDDKKVKHTRMESSLLFTYDAGLGPNVEQKSTGTTVSTDFITYQRMLKTRKLELWIVLVSFCAGIIIFMIISIILLKVGFFRRKHREDLLTLRKLQSRHFGRSRVSSEETSERGEGSNENLVMATDYRTVAYDLSGESSPDSPISRTFDDTEYLEPIQTLVRS